MIGSRYEIREMAHPLDALATVDVNTAMSSSLSSSHSNKERHGHICVLNCTMRGRYEGGRLGSRRMTHRRHSAQAAPSFLKVGGRRVDGVLERPASRRERLAPESEEENMSNSSVAPLEIDRGRGRCNYSGLCKSI